MTGKRLSLASLLLFSAAIPIWISVTYIVITSPGFGGGLHRYFLAPLVLSIASVAIYRLIRSGPARKPFEAPHLAVPNRPMSLADEEQIQEPSYVIAGE